MLERRPRAECDERSVPPIVPIVELIDPPRIRIYDPNVPDAYYYRGIGFTSTFAGD